VAEEIDAFCRTARRDSSGRAHAGLLTGQDMATWSATYEDAVSIDHGDWTVAKCGAWTQGPVLLQQLRLLEGFDLSYMDGLPTAATVHAVLECAKLAFADREAWYGDTDVPLDDLLSRSYAAERRKLVTDTASFELRPGSPGGRVPLLPEPPAPREVQRSVEVGEHVITRDGRTRGDTVHVDVVDRHGNMISATPSGGWLQSSPTVPGLGFCLNSRAEMFWLTEGLPNSLVGGKRPRITLTPTMALHAGGPALAFGTPGGDGQDQWQLCFWLAHTLGGLNLQAAIDAPTWHSTAFPSSFYPRSSSPGEVYAESRLGADVLDDLTRRGHRVIDAGPWSLGRMCAVGRGDGLLRAAANPRGMQGYAAGR
jgi:gamma-glutamyltranspeptidase/glutathione hydrolase